jgi:hypothetical protein
MVFIEGKPHAEIISPQDKAKVEMLANITNE